MLSLEKWRAFQARNDLCREHEEVASECGASGYGTRKRHVWCLDLPGRTPSINGSPPSLPIGSLSERSLVNGSGGDDESRRLSSGRRSSVPRSALQCLYVVVSALMLLTALSRASFLARPPSCPLCTHSCSQRRKNTCFIGHDMETRSRLQLRKLRENAV